MFDECSLRQDSANNMVDTKGAKENILWQSYGNTEMDIDMPEICRA